MTTSKNTHGSAMKFSKNDNVKVWCSGNKHVRSGLLYRPNTIILHLFKVIEVTENFIATIDEEDSKSKISLWDPSNKYLIQSGYKENSKRSPFKNKGGLLYAIYPLVEGEQKLVENQRLLHRIYENIVKSAILLDDYSLEEINAVLQKHRDQAIIEKLETTGLHP